MYIYMSRKLKRTCINRSRLALVHVNVRVLYSMNMSAEAVGGMDLLFGMMVCGGRDGPVGG